MQSVTSVQADGKSAGCSAFCKPLFPNQALQNIANGIRLLGLATWTFGITAGSGSAVGKADCARLPH